MFVHTASGIDVSDVKLEESRTLELDYNGYFSMDKDAGADMESYVWRNKIDLNKRVEKKQTGNWQRIDLNVNTNKSGIDKTTYTQWDVDLGSKWYLGNSPFFLYTSLLGDQAVTSGQSGDKGVNSRIIGGTGGGRVVDLANWLRAKKVETALIEDGLLDGEVPRKTFEAIIKILRSKKKIIERVLEVNELLSKEGLLKVDKFDLDTVYLLSEIIEESTDRLESGFEGRLGYGRDISKQNDDEDKSGYITGMLKYAKPLSDKLELSETVNYFRSVGGDVTLNFLLAVTQLKYDLERTQLVAKYTYSWNKYEWEVYSYGKQTYSTTNKYNQFTIRYIYQIYNKINLSANFKARSQEVPDNKGGKETKWDQEFVVQFGYEIF